MRRRACQGIIGDSFINHRACSKVWKQCSMGDRQCLLEDNIEPKGPNTASCMCMVHDGKGYSTGWSRRAYYCLGVSRVPSYHSFSGSRQDQQTAAAWFVAWWRFVQSNSKRAYGAAHRLWVEGEFYTAIHPSYSVSRHTKLRVQPILSAFVMIMTHRHTKFEEGLWSLSWEVERQITNERGPSLI